MHAPRYELPGSDHFLPSILKLNAGIVACVSAGLANGIADLEMTSFAWRFQIPALSTHYRVIAPDLRGYGETDKPASGYDKRNMANDLRELMKALDIRR